MKNSTEFKSPNTTLELNVCDGNRKTWNVNNKNTSVEEISSIIVSSMMKSVKADLNKKTSKKKKRN